MTSVFRFFLALTVLMGSVAGTTYFLNSQGQFNLAETRLALVELDSDVGQSPLEKQWKSEIQELVEPLRGVSLWTISLKSLRAEIEKKPWVSEVNLHKRWWNRLSIDVVPKSIAFYLLNEGKIVVVFEDGSLMQELPLPLLPSRPIARDLLFERDSKLRNDMIQLLKLLPQQGVLARDQINEVSWSAFDGFTLSLRTASTKVLLGTGNMPKKLSRVSRVLQYLVANQQTGRVIDAAYSQKVLVRLRNGP